MAVCYSWLLDSQLRRYLPEDSNILRFQDRFRPLYPETEEDDTLPVGFVSATRGGGHWYGGNGWLTL